MAPPTLRYPLGDTVVPGDRLGSIRQVQAGSGTRVVAGQIYATLVGVLRLDANDNESSSDAGGGKGPAYTCRVETTSSTAKSAVLQVGQLIIGRVVRITPQNAVVQICFLEGLGPPPSHISLEGAIRMEDIRTGASEQLRIEDCFQPSDMVACRVISLGDSRRYYLTTAETELGVLRARCRTSGQMMIPISWKEMQCPTSGVVELRKCAKPGGPATTKEPMEAGR